MYKTLNIDLDQLLLDPLNYRLLDLKGYTSARSNRFHELSVQAHVVELLQSDGSEELQALKDSIRVNGYVPLEMLVVRPYKYRPGKYVVVEGNRRVAAAKWLLKDVAAGVDVDKSVLSTFEKLSAIVIDPKKKGQDSLQSILIGVRHVSGIRQWRGYQRAKLLSEMVGRHQFSLTEAAERIGMTPHEANRRLRAMSALEQMQKDEEFCNSATPGMYRLFHEAVSSTKIKEWLGWDEREQRFMDENRVKDFYRMLIPSTSDPDDPDSSSNGEPKLRTYLDVRSLNEVLGNDEALEVLLDPERSLADALAFTKASYSSDWASKVRAAQKAVKRLEVEQLKQLKPEEVQALSELRQAIDERLTDWHKLAGPHS